MRIIDSILAVLILLIWLTAGIVFGMSGIHKEESVESISRLEEKYNPIIKTLEERLSTLRPDAPSDSVQHVKITKKLKSVKKKKNALIMAILDNNSAGLPFMKKIPQTYFLFIAACGFGALGGVIRVVFEFVYSNVALTSARSFFIPLLGMLSGLMVVAVSDLAPNLLAQGDFEMRDASVIFLSMFMGIFSKRFYLKIEDTFSGYLSEENPSDQ